MANKDDLGELMDIVRVLRSEKGCPWDRKQTHDSLKPCMLEEAYEVIEAINQDDTANLREELGDVLLQVALHSVIAEEREEFTFDEVVHEVSEKMIRRHPHVFGTSEENSVDGIAVQWEEIKRKEHKEETLSESLVRVPNAMPASMKTAKIQKKMAKAGLNLTSEDEALEVVSQALERVQFSLEKRDMSRIEDEYGELLFAVLNLSIILGLNAENSLTNAVDKFINRLVGIERIASREGKGLAELSINYENELWKLNKNKQ